MADPEFLHAIAPDAHGPAPLLALADAQASLSEVSERISNNLALLASTVSMRATALARSGDELTAGEAAAMLHEITARIVAVGHLHRLISSQPGVARVEIGSHLRELCRLFISSLTQPGQVELVEHAIEHCAVSVDDALHVSLIVTEVVTNALHYAHPAGVPGKLMIGCRHRGSDSIMIEVGDDGVGLPEGFDFATSTGVGARTIRVLAQQIGAEVSFESCAIGLWFALELQVD